MAASHGRWLITVFPYVGIVLGAGMVGLGVWILFGQFIRPPRKFLIVF
jgi:hypothetical protein